LHSFVSFEFVNTDRPNTSGAKLYLSRSESGKKVNEKGVIPLDIAEVENEWYTIIGTFKKASPSNKTLIHNSTLGLYYGANLLTCIWRGDILNT